MSVYPYTPGWKRRDTAQQAAAAMEPKAKTLREKVLDVLRVHDCTADEVAENVGKSILSIRPRLSELVELGKIEDTGGRRKNESGHRAIVWRVPEAQRDLF